MPSFWQQLAKPILALAPMEGYTDSAFRLLAREQGADVVYTEFVSSDAIAHRGKTALAKLTFDPAEQPVVAQIFGRDPAAFVTAAKEIERRGFAGLDLNFGCPARKVIGSGAGVALLRDPQYARRLIESVLDVLTIPLSIKIRASIRAERREVAPDTEQRHTALDLIEAIRDLPVATVMVHGRSFEQGFSGGLDVEMIRAVKQRFPGLVLANGGLRTVEDVEHLLTATGADGVGLARGALGCPWLFRQIRAYLSGRDVPELSWPEIRAVAERHARQAVAAKGGRGLTELRKHLAHYATGQPRAATLRARLVRAATLDDVRRTLAEVTVHA
ncbi:MAG: tRNA-dihydrouridine synthase [Candidatus Kerfeldbacteria bacterium]|nr:tRNA-dihydrouridine synthase [Candidatus Kerfeldbacteria bacterium]